MSVSSILNTAANSLVNRYQSTGQNTNSIMDHIYIGKIPAYNKKLTSKISYEKRLINNLTITTFTPVGYNINILNELDQNQVVTNINNSKTIYKMGTNLKSKFNLSNSGTTISTSSALENWLDMQNNLIWNGGSSSPITSSCKTFSIISTNDSTINETISNEYGTNKINDWPSLLSTFSTKAGDLAGKLKNVANLATTGMTSVDSNAMIELLRKKDQLTGQSDFLKLLSAQAIGIQTALPKIWQRSDYNNTSSFTIKLISPSGHPDDVQRYVLDPLTRLVLAASPITFDGVSYGYPPIWKVEAKGLLNINLAAITAIVITRGGQDTLFNRYNQPTNIDVRITVEPLVNGFATPLTPNMTYKPNENGDLKMLVSNPLAISETMLQNAGGNTFNLETLELN